MKRKKKKNYGFSEIGRGEKGLRDKNKVCENMSIMEEKQGTMAHYLLF